MQFKQHFKGFQAINYGPEIGGRDFEKEVLAAEKRVIEEFGFVKEEVDFIMRKKPSFLF